MTKEDFIKEVKRLCRNTFIIKRFVAWLIANSCYDEYIQGLRNGMKDWSVDDENGKCLIHEAFLWSDSSEGYEYWSEKDSQWKRHLSKLPNARYL